MNLFNSAGIIGDAIADVWMSIWLSLNNLVYNIIEILYRVFETIAKINLFSDKDYAEITNRIYVIMGVAMLFILAYNLVLMIINPEDKKGTGQMTKMIKEIIISLILIVLLPRVFSYMSILQRHILDSNILGQIIIGDSGGTTPTCNYDEYTLLDQYQIQNVSGGTASVELNNDCNEYNELSPGVKGAYSIAPTLFQAFYHPTNYGFTQCKEYMDTCKDDTSCTTDVISDDEDKKMCTYYFHDVSKAVYIGSLKPFNEDSEFYSKVKNNSEDFEFNYLLAFVAGCFAVWMFVCYTVAIGVRVAKLGFLQILSPIAVMMRIIPKQKEAIFDKWLKQLTNAYLDVFIRLAIIYFALFAISLVPGVIDNLAVETDGNTAIGNFAVWLLAKVVLILGILKFAQDSPSLLKEFFNFSGQFSLKSPKKQFDENTLANKGIGMLAGGIGGGAVGLVRNFHKSKEGGDSTGRSIYSATRGAFGGIYYGSKNGLKNGTSNISSSISSAADTVDEKRETYNAYRADGNGNYFVGYVKGKVDSARRAQANFKDFMIGDVGSSSTGDAANAIIGRAENIENTFSNARINNIIAGRSKVNEDYNAGREFDFNGTKYRKIDANTWSEVDAQGNNRIVRNADGTVASGGISHSDLGDKIKNYYRDAIAQAYGDNINKDKQMRDGFKIASQSLIKELRNSMPKMGESFAKDLFDKLNSNGLDLNVNNFDELDEKITEILNSNDSNQLEKLYKINDEVKTLTKSFKVQNQQAVEAQKARQEQNKKNNENK